ncbi:hypothetical protein EJB05_18121 [Eragrostis curvula]|uniref:Peptidase S1 domain-containing protein n=1 Tax=Eragrostis curvula TaxID=38414 RepID=A0A5J9VIZ5_9POAL|nr:hypothetical protein EJB05_18121 [Eragrostis curvula]
MDIQELAKETLKEHEKSVVLIIIRSATTGAALNRGTGFVIGRKGTSYLVMTCAHILQKLDDGILNVRLAGESKEHMATKMDRYCDDGTDIAIIKVDNVHQECNALQFCDAVDVAAKTVVIKLGYILVSGSSRHTLKPSVCIGTVATQLLQNGSKGIEDLVYSASGKHGLSGSAVMLGNEVIGVYYFGEANSDIIILLLLIFCVSCGLAIERAPRCAAPSLA